MPTVGYPETELVRNRAALLIHGAGENDRRAWAEEASANFPNEGLTTAVDAAALDAALARTNGVVYVPDAAAVGLDAQARALRVLLEREERPKLVIGLSMTPAEAVSKGVLLDALAYRLQQAVVDLSAPGLRDAIRSRRMKSEERNSTARRLLTATAKKTQRAAPRKASRKPTKSAGKKKKR